MYREWASVLPGAVVWRRTAATESNTGRVLPDGCMDLIWWGGEILVAGPDTAAHLSTIGAGEALVGLRFAPGTGPAVLGVPANELRDTRVPLGDLWPVRDVRLIEERTATDPVTALERLAAARLAAAGGPEPLAGRIAAGLRTGMAVTELADRLGLSARQLHRRCLPAFGYGAKTLARILRMQRALRRARAGGSLADVASLSGYADQAHFTREVRALAGAPPRELLAHS
ncbi:helix-turn-helix transcriptional regulator [Actinomycetes bacterium KLBMP 9797]